MTRTLFLSIVVIIIFILNAFSLGNEKEGHVCFRSVDADKNGIVTLKEFTKIFGDDGGDDKEKFEEVDLNDDGNLSHDEYHQALGHGSS